MTDAAPSNPHARLWWLSGGLFSIAALGAGLLLVGYDGPHSHAAKQAAPESASKAQSAPLAAAAGPADAPRNGTAIPIPVPVSKPVAAGATPDPQTYLDQRFPNQVVADVKIPTPEDTERQVRAAFPDYGKLLDENAKNPQPPNVAAAPPADRPPLTDSER